METKIKDIINLIIVTFTYVQRFEVLKKLIKKNNYKSFVEVGVWDGTTSKYLLRKTNINKIVCVDNYPPDNFDMGKGVLKAKAKAKELTNNPKVTFLELSSEKASRLIKDNSIDIVFIDSDHSYKSVKKDIELWFPKVRKGGMITGDDYQIKFMGVIKAVNEKFKQFRLYNRVWEVRK